MEITRYQLYLYSVAPAFGVQFRFVDCRAISFPVYTQHYGLSILFYVRLMHGLVPVLAVFHSPVIYDLLGLSGFLQNATELPWKYHLLLLAVQQIIVHFP